MTPRFGPRVEPGATIFRLWAPDADRVELQIEGAEPHPMQAGDEGWFSLRVPGAGPGTAYRFRVAGHDVPDPASRGQEKDADGWSLIQPGPPPPSGRRARPWHEAIIAEIHVGAATEAGTFRALIERLDHYAEAGFTAIELMPVADFPGRWNWGYDGVLPFAPDRSYGSREDLRALIDAAHARGLEVLLDVVYNHFGPSGNYLPLYAKSFFRADISTPWGAAINLENPVVRAFFVENAQYWLGELDCDGLRFDAIHALTTKGVETFLRELAAGCRAVKPDAWLVLENHDNAAGWMTRDDALYTAQWNDDWHHVFHVLATGERSGYYAPYASDPTAGAARALSEGFVFQGEPYPDTNGHPRGAPSGGLPPDAFVGFIQNHDHIGNRPLGDRLAVSVPPERLALLRFVLMLSPEIPLLFMGEEALLATPFPFFCDFDGDLAEAVRTGRRSEFPDFFAHHDAASFPDPLAEATFRSARIAPADFETPHAKAELAAFRHLTDARRRLVWPLTGSAYRGAGSVREGDALLVNWRFEAGTLTMALNFGDKLALLPLPQGSSSRPHGSCLWQARGQAPAQPESRDRSPIPQAIPDTAVGRSGMTIMEAVGDAALDAEGQLALGPFAGAVWSAPP